MWDAIRVEWELGQKGGGTLIQSYLKGGWEPFAVAPEALVSKVTGKKIAARTFIYLRKKT